ncbi:hypothetical protein PUN28_018380 [Cardiocondyla obscurior]|uniref:F-box domain-containing protein n=1 Tax=Cardiocondyla obscurior TaxID=286306 RepID=A0AAW2EIM6_9HYME
MEGTSQKRTRTEKPGAARNDGATSSDESTLDSSTYLTYDVLRIVFQYLSARNLANAAVVCRSWLEAANDERCTRGPCCFFQCYRKQNDSDLLSCIANIRIKPSVGFFFIPEYTPRIIEVCIWKLLPEDCETVMLYSNGIIVENNEMEKHTRPNIVCAFLPQIPNVKIKSFKIVRKAIERSAEFEEIMSIIANQEIAWARGESSTCFMLFCNDLGHNLAKHWASAVKQRYNLHLNYS